MSRTPVSTLLIATLLSAAVLATVLWAWDRTARRATLSPPTLATLYPAPQPLPDFALTAADGSRFDRDRFRRHWTLLFLGFTQCPDVCPATLTTLAAARRALLTLQGPGRLPEVVLISVDPAHDTPAALAAYLLHFDPSFVGASGDPAALAPLAAALGAYAAPAEGTAGIVHSGAVYLIDPAARIAAVYTTLPAPLALAADVRRILRARGGP